MRVVREKKTQLGKGFGYVGFHDAGSVERALLLQDLSLLLQQCYALLLDLPLAGRAPLRIVNVYTPNSGERLQLRPPLQLRPHLPELLPRLP